MKNFWQSLLNKLIKIKKTEIESQEELITYFKQAANKSIINAETFVMLENILNLCHLKVRDIMMPRGQMISIKENLPLDAIIEIINESGHSRFPVLSEHEDDILGILHAKDLLHLTDAQTFDLIDIIRQATFVPESKRLDALLADFRINRNHMAIVVDEYGHSTGFVTLEDTIEEIIGEVADEFDVEREDPIKKLSSNQYIVQGDTEINLINERLTSEFNSTQVDTIGGLITSLFGYPPKRGEHIDYKHFHFKIISATSRRIKLLEMTDHRHGIPDHDE